MKSGRPSLTPQSVSQIVLNARGWYFFRHRMYYLYTICILTNFGNLILFIVYFPSR